MKKEGNLFSCDAESLFESPVISYIFSYYTIAIMYMLFMKSIQISHSTVQPVLSKHLRDNQNVLA